MNGKISLKASRKVSRDLAKTYSLKKKCADFNKLAVGQDVLTCHDVPEVEPGHTSECTDRRSRGVDDGKHRRHRSEHQRQCKTGHRRQPVAVDHELSVRRHAVYNCNITERCLSAKQSAQTILLREMESLYEETDTTNCRI